MSNRIPFQCRCRDCTAGNGHPKKRLHRQLNLLLSRLNEQERRWFVALESRHYGRGGISLMARVTGMAIATIRRGRAELDVNLDGRPANRARLPGGGRPPIEKESDNREPHKVCSD